MGVFCFLVYVARRSKCSASLIPSYFSPLFSLLTMKEHYSRSKKRNAFALVLAIGAMAFMVLLVLTLSSIVSAKLRLLNAQKENRMARSNALLGMSVALSELQRSMGPDNAVSAPATIFDTDPTTVQVDGVRTPYVIGAIPVETEKKGKTFYDAQQDEREIIDLLKEGKTVDSSEISWLVSSEQRMLNPSIESPAELSEESVKLASYSQLTDFPTTMGGKVTSQLKSETVDVEAGKVALENGAYAWWVSDESLKAKINMVRQDEYLDAQTTGSAEEFEGPADRLIPQVSYNSFIDEFSRFQLNPFLSSFDEESSKILSKATSFDEVAMLDSSLTEWVQKNKNDYTVSSLGIPVDVTQGRLKEDLSVFLTKDGSGKGLNDNYSIIRGSEDDKNYTGPDFGLDSYDRNIPRMGLLRDWATMFDDTGENFEDGIKARPQKNLKNEVQHGLYPIIAKATWTFRLAYRANGVLGSGSSIRLYLVFYPRISIYNPHQVTIKASDYLVRLMLPYALELATPCEGYFSGDENEVAEKFPPLALRYDSVAVEERSSTEPGKEEVIRRFHPYKIFAYNGSGSAAQGINAPSNFNRSMAVTFRKILNESSLCRGTDDHATDDSSVNGTPVLSMRVDSLELKPGETLELVPYDGSSRMQTYTAPGSFEIIPNRSSSSYPELRPVMTVQSGYTYTRGVGLLIDTGLDFVERENLINTNSDEWAEPDISEEFKTAVKPNGNSGNPRVVASWRVVPLLNNNALFSFTSDTTKTKQGHSYLGYEIWAKDGGSYEYLTGLDTAMLTSSGNKTVAADKNYRDGSGRDQIWHYSRTKAFQPNFPHVNTTSAPVPMRFSIGYNWNRIVEAFKDTPQGNPTNTSYSYLNPSSERSGYYGFTGNGGDYCEYLGSSGSISDSTAYDSYRQRPCFELPNQYLNDMGNRTCAHYMTPLVPSIDSIQNVPWKASGFDGAGIAEVPNTLDYADMGMIRVDEDLTSRFNDVASGDVKVYGGRGGAYAGWSITTLGPSKDKASDAAAAGAAYMPPYMALMNPLRDNGAVPRVDAFHSYNLVLVDPFDDGYGSRLNWKMVLFTQGDDRYFGSHPIDETSNSQYIDTSGDFDWTSKYDSEGKYRRGTSTLFYISTTAAHGDCGYFSTNAWTKNDTSYAMPVFDFVRNSEQVMSLGVFANANLSTMLWQPQRALGESWASPFIKREEIINTQDSVLHDNELIDLSYMLNASVWDRFYLSTIPQEGLREPYAGMRMRNPRHILTNLDHDNHGSSELYGDKMAFERSAAHIGVEGAFNVNSTSYEAWRAFLGGMLGTKKETLLEDDYPETEDTSSPTNFYMPNPGNLNTVLKPQDPEKKVGYRDVSVGRNISEAEIDELAREIVAEVKRRAPFFSLADFINRRLIKYSDTSGDEDLSYQSLMGTMSAAIARVAEQQLGSKATIFNADYNFTKQNPSATDLLRMMRDTSRESIEQASMAPYGKSYRRSAGLPGAQLLQSQLLTAYAPFMTVRGDTFTIRAYGEYLNPMTGTSAKAYCEALVQRSAEPVEPSDDIVKPLEPFGRKFKIVSFRWLTPAEL